MPATAALQPKISIQDEEVIVSIPRILFEQPIALSRSHASTEVKKKADFSSLKGIFKDIKELPEFKGKSSVEIQHMITRDLWTKRYTSSTQT